jgi:Flp pilus assembly protein TadD
VQSAWERTSSKVEPLIPAGSLKAASDILRLPGRADASVERTNAAPASDGPSESEFERMLAARRARIEALKIEGPRLIRAGDGRRAIGVCRAWVDLDLGNAQAWRCLGQAHLAAGQYQEALNAFRKARQHAPDDRSIDAEIERAERGIVNQFLTRYRR